MLTFTKAIEEIAPQVIADDDDPLEDTGDVRQLYLIRHASTELNAHDGAVDRIRGWRDVPLSDQGKAETIDLAEQLADSGIDLLVYSDFQRTRDTAAAIARTTGAEVVASSKFRPWNVGAFTGRSSNDAHPELVQYATDKPDVPLPGGESFNHFKDRVFEGLRDVVQMFPDRDVGIVTHHRVERLINAWIEAGQPPDFEIDVPTMFDFGEKPASYELVNIDVNALGCEPIETDEHDDVDEASKEVELSKDMTASDAHHTTAIGNSGEKFISAVTDIKEKKKKKQNESTGQVLSPEIQTPGDYQWTRDQHLEHPRDQDPSAETKQVELRKEIDALVKARVVVETKPNEKAKIKVKVSPQDEDEDDDDDELPIQQPTDEVEQTELHKLLLQKDSAHSALFDVLFDGKKAQMTDWRLPLDIVKQEPDKHLVFGWASICELDGKLVVDKQGDVIEPDELEKAAYDFVLYSRSQGDMHERKGVGRLVESMVFTAEKQRILGIELGLQGWWVGFKVDDESVWQDLKAGKLPEFSIGGKGVRVPMN